MQNQMLVRLVGSLFKTNRYRPVLLGLVACAGGALPMAAWASTALTVTGLTAYNKVYDGANIATLNTNAAVLHGIIGTDDVYLDTNYYTATFASSQVGGPMGVTVSSLGLAGANKANYTLTLPGGLQATITPRELGIAVTAADKT